MRWVAMLPWLLMATAATAAGAGFAPPLATRFELGAPLSVEQVRDAPGDLVELASSRPNLGYVGLPLWVRADLSAIPAPRRDWLVELAQPLVDHVDAYVVADNVVVATYSAGDLRPFAARAFAHRNIVVPLPETAATELQLFMRIATEGSVALPIAAWPAATFLARDGSELLQLGMLFGLLASLVAYNGFLYLTVRDRSYLYYVGYLGGALLLQLTLHGLAAQFLWPGSAGIGNAAVILLLGLTLWAGTGFSRNFLQTPTRQPRLDRVLAANGWACLGAAMLGFVSYRWGVQLLILLGLAQLPVIAWGIVAGLIGGFRPARFIGLGFAALMPGGIVYALRTFGVIASTPLTDRAFEIGIALEAVLLSFGLADRINTLTRDKQMAEAAAAAERERFAHRLVERQEQDRRRIANALHDSVVQTLGALGNRLRRQPSAAELAELSEVTRETTRELRDIVDDLHPHQLERLGLAAALRSVGERAFAGTGVRWSATLDAEVRLAPGVAVQLYRIAQEAVANVAKHAGATACELTFTGTILTIRDNGHGLAPGAAGGLGLASIAERATLIGAALRIEAEPAGGTRIVLELP